MSHYFTIKGLNQMRSLHSLHLEFLPRQEVSLLQETFCEGFLPQISSIGITTSGREDQVYPIIARACPNLKVLYLCSTNPDIEFQTIKEMVVQFDKLEMIIIHMEFPGNIINHNKN
jgi:hypothetical protein